MTVTELIQELTNYFKESKNAKARSLDRADGPE